MAQNIAIHSLVTARESLIAEKNAAIERFNQQIGEIETALAQLSGKKVWEVLSEIPYDDTNPDYIKGSIED